MMMDWRVSRLIRLERIDRGHVYPLVQRNFQAMIQAARVVILENTDLSPRAFDELGELSVYGLAGMMIRG